MSLTHKKKFKKQIVNNNIFSKLKKKKRALKYIGGVHSHPNPNNSNPPSKKVMAYPYHNTNNENAMNNLKGSVNNMHAEFGQSISNAMTGMNNKRKVNSVESDESNAITGMNNKKVNSVVSDESSPMNVNNNIGEFVETNTRFIQSELKSNPFYAKKSTSIVENKKMYNLDTNYIMSEIKKMQSVDPNLIVNSEIISSILAGKQKASDQIPLDHTKQQELHMDFCDF
jgi:hypothetical protein